MLRPNRAPSAAPQEMPGNMTIAWPRWLVALLVAAIMLCAFGLRVYAVGWGLPYVDNPDEGSGANRALGMVRRGDWNPRFFGKPSLYYYALRFVFAAHLRYGIATGLYHGVNDLPRTTDLYLPTPGLFIWGRMLTVLLGTATVLLLFAVGRRWWNVRVGLIAAALLAVSPFHMRHSQYISLDVPSAFMALLALAAALRLLDDTRWRAYALAGLCAGLSASTKYNAGMVVLALVVAHAAVWGKASARQFPRVLWAGLWALAGFIAATPYTVLDSGAFLAGLLKQYSAYAPQDTGDLPQTWPVRDYLAFFWNTGLTPIPALAALLGMGVALARRNRAALVLLAFVLPYPLLFLPQRVHYFRNMLPIIPPLLIFAGIGCDVALLRLTTAVQSLREGRFHPALRRAAQAVIMLLGALLLVGWPLRDAVALTRFEAQPHSMVRAYAFLQSLPRGAPIGAALNPVQVAGQPFITPFKDVAGHPADWYRSQGYRYLIANTRDTDQQRYAALRSQATAIATFAGDKEGQPGPHMEALDLGTRPEQLAITQQEATFGGRLKLLGYQRGAGRLRPAFSPLSGDERVRRGDALLINLYWQPLARMNADYALFLHLLDAAGHTITQRDTVIRGADYPTSRWQPGELAVELADLPLPPDVPNGDYRLMLGVYNMQTMERLPIDGRGATELDLMRVVMR